MIAKEITAPAARRMFLFLLVLTVASALGFQGWRTLINNFAVEVGGLSGFDMGLVQSIREIPGFLALLVIYLLLFISEHRLGALSVLIMGLGVALTGLLPTTSGIILTTLIMSFGFHYYETVNQSLTLQYFDYGTAPLVFGRLKSLGAATNILVGVLIFLLSSWLSYAQLFAVLGGIVVLAGAWCLTRDPSDKELPPQRREMVFRKRYWLFYVLSLLAGSRRQIFVAFAVFLLVKKFDFSVQEITILFVVNNVIGYFANPLIGRAVNRFGERAVLSLEYAVLIVVFLTYAYTDSRLVVACMYIVDHLVFNFSMAIRTFFQKIADRQDIAPSMAVGFTINHVAAVAIPALGGILWLVDYRIVFLGGVGLALGSLALTQLIPGQLAAAGRGRK
ncbi:MAG TPA: MFS transporter [Desulfomicrobiaceae bacterium]|nr:MFS transporter [Desulfomicrobiaceae bacterium]